MQFLDVYLAQSMWLVSRLTNFSSMSFFTSFFEFLNFFIIVVVLFCSTYSYILRKLHKTSSKNEILLTVWVVVVTTLSIALLTLSKSIMYPSFFYAEAFTGLLNSISFADIVFVSLFLLITPLTLVLLVREERFSTFFCILNFTFLLIVVVFLVTTKNIVGLVMAYELVFIPSFFIMRRTVYSSSALSAYSVFTVWSVLGSLVVVSGAVYLVSVLGYSATQSALSSLSFNKTNLLVVSTLFFVGFGVKIPVWPFHYWLTRVHVEASTGFSIFLSGFLVKAAVYVCWKVVMLLGISNINIVFTCLCLYSVLDGVIKIITQTDIKKLVAFATVFEMGLIYLFILWKPAQSCVYVYAFCFSHAFLSGLMFFLVDVIYSRTKTRSIDLITGLVVHFPSISKAVWLFLFIFWGLPFTLKFFIEMWVLLALISASSTILFIYIVVILFFSNVFVTKVWLQLLYGSPQVKNYQSDLSVWEVLAITYLVLLNSLASIAFIYVFN